MNLTGTRLDEGQGGTHFTQNDQFLAVSLLFSCCFPAATMLPEASQQQGNSNKVAASQ